MKVELPDRPPLAVFNLEGEFFAIDDTCTHGEASLSDGEVFGEDVVCPFHSGSFCIRTGEATGYPAVVPVRSYRTLVSGDDVIAEIPAVQE
jgi:nitrite reductase/ring-hydroxylating ferredoxin subunit